MQQRQTNVPMEPRGLVARWEPFSEELTVYVSSQSPHEGRMYLADIFDLPEHQVRVIMRDVGGAFGQKFSVARDEAATVIASRRLGVPVKWIEDRYENLTASNHAREESFHVKAGVMDDGTITAWSVRHHDSLGAYPLNPIEVNAFLATLVFPGPYKTPKYGFEALATYSNTAARGAYRGPWMMETVARETMIDVIARDLGLDPAEVRRRNLIRLEDQPFQTPMQLQYDNITPGETFDQAVEMIGYEAFRAEQAGAREQGRYLGVGTAAYVEPTAMGIGSLGVEVATIRVEPTGRVNVLMGTGSHGHSLETTMIQVVAEHLGVAIEDVVLKQGDTAISPFGGGTGGSRSAVIAGGVARISAAQAQGEGARDRRPLDGDRARGPRDRGRRDQPEGRPGPLDDARPTSRRSPTSRPTSCPTEWSRDSRTRRATRRRCSRSPTRRTSAPARSTPRPARSRSWTTSSARTAA